MEKVKTMDSSYTLYSKEYRQTYHSVSGALEESFQKFAIPALSTKLHRKRITILDICFGIGYNSAAALHYIRKSNHLIRVCIVGIEKDKSVICCFNKEDMPAIIRKDYQQLKDQVKSGQTQIIIGDAKTEVGRLKLKFDAVFLDPFSPRECPDLWTEEFIKDIYGVMRKKGILTTYSCAGKVRKNLESAGFHVRDGPCIGRRAPSTIAVKP